MFSKVVQLLLFSAILFRVFAMSKFINRFCPIDEFLCENRTHYYCTRLDTLCDGADNCDNGKDEICDGKLHIPTGICAGSDERHCKDASKGSAICSAGCAQCTGRDECTACAVNFSGKYCNETCPSRTFGLNCELDCDYLTSEKSKFYSLCYSDDDDDDVCNSKEIRDVCKATCECKRVEDCEWGWIGNRCQVPCSGFTFGYLCSKNCTCVRENTIRCNIEDGTCICKPNFYGENCQADCGRVKSEFSEDNLNCLERKVQTLSDDKAALEQSLNDHKTAVEQRLADHKSSLDQTFGDYKHHLNWNSWLTCVALVLLFVVVGKMYLKNRKLKANLISVRYSGRQRNDSASETKVTFSCTETTNPPVRSNLFQSALERARRLTQNVSNSNSRPICGTSLLEQANQTNANVYETIEELKQKAKQEAIQVQKN